MNVIKNIVFLFLAYCTLNVQAQSNDTRIGVISDIDTSMMHLYVGKLKSDNSETLYPFNLKKYFIGEFDRILDTINTQFHTNLEIEFHPLSENYKAFSGLLNFFGKPNKKTLRYLEKLKSEHNINYFILITFQTVNADSENAFLNGYEYGVASYEEHPRLMTYFTLVRYVLLNSESMEVLDHEYQTDYQTDALVFDFALNQGLSLDDREKLTDEHLTFAINNLKEMTSIKIEKILRTLLQNIQK